ncbi:MAG TPA: VCBS repeat-containing protein, partial [Thermoanaerobaculia bacterium]
MRRAVPLPLVLLVVAAACGGGERSADSGPSPSRVVVPPDAESVDWLADRAAEQRAAVEESGVIADFHLVDRRGESGIDFHHRIVPDAAKTYKPVHYDHGNAVAAADVDGDGRVDLFFVNQVGPSELWRNTGGGRFEEITESAGLT